MIDPALALGLGFVSGAAGGLVLSLLTWLASSDPFKSRKNIAGIITAVITGILATSGLGQTGLLTSPDTQVWELLGAYVTIFAASAGFGSMVRIATSSNGHKPVLPSGGSP